MGERKGIAMDMFDLDSLLIRSLREDIGSGDITTESCVSADAISSGHFIAKEPGVICGIDIAARVFALVDSKIEFKVNSSDGNYVTQGMKIAEISGPSRGILTGERVALNLLQRLSGIATRTKMAACELQSSGAAITDTRKTTPGLRVLEKYAVRTGGGTNHRFGLSDGVLIKDNHIKAAGGITNAVRAARALAPHTIRIEVETETLLQVSESLEAGADIIMLDNMDTQTMEKAVKLIDGRALTEASGNMDSKSLAEVAATGVDFISMGALTHSVKSMDISLRFI